MKRPLDDYGRSKRLRPLLAAGLAFFTALAVSAFSTTSFADGMNWHSQQGGSGDQAGGVHRSEHVRAGDQKDQVRLLWTNDTHGYFMPVYHAEANEASAYPQRAATEGKVGGYAYIEALVKKLKPRRLNALFMDSGDTFDGSPLAQITKGAGCIPVINSMGYDAWTPGNRDFAYGEAQFLQLTSMMTVPKVSSTLRYANNGQLVFPPYLIKQLPTMKVAIIGLTHPLMTNGFALGKQLAPNASSAGFEVASEITALVAQIRATYHPDLVVALSHFGYPQDVKFASQQAGVDVILGAHTHHNVFVPTVIKGTDGHDVLIVQAGSHGKFLGDLDVYVHNHHIFKYHYRIIRVIDKKIKPDPTVLAIAEQAYAPYKQYFDQVIGKTSTILIRRGQVQGSMENLITDAYASMYGADVSAFPGIRYGTTVLPGNITVGDVWNIVSPNFGNNGMYVGAVAGNYVYQQLNSNIQSLNSEYGTDPYGWLGGDVIRFNHNVQYTYKVNAPDNQHIVNLKIGNDYLVQNGQPVAANLSKMYTYAASFPAGAPYSTPPVPGTTAVDELIDYIQQQPNQTVSAVRDDRAVRVDPCLHGCQGGPNAAAITNVGVASSCYSWSTPGCRENDWVTGYVNGGVPSDDNRD